MFVCSALYQLLRGLLVPRLVLAKDFRVAIRVLVTRLSKREESFD